MSSFCQCSDPAREPVRNKANLCCEQMSRSIESSAIFSGSPCASAPPLGTEGVEEGEDQMMVSFITICTTGVEGVVHMELEDWHFLPGFGDVGELVDDNNDDGEVKIQRWITESQSPWTTETAGRPCYRQLCEVRYSLSFLENGVSLTFPSCQLDTSSLFPLDGDEEASLENDAMESTDETMNEDAADAVFPSLWFFLHSLAAGSTRGTGSKCGVQ